LYLYKSAITPDIPWMTTICDINILPHPSSDIVSDAAKSG